jgi:tRNA-5-methyluridine54 2-sulfurtransferase
MRCRKCGEKAAINMRHHRLALCKEHYLDWFIAQTERFIQKYKMFTHQERILVAVSGGKDSLALWDVLHRLEYQADGLYLGLGIDEGVNYSDESRQMCEIFAAERSLTLHTIDIQENYGNSIPGIVEKLHRVQKKPCSVCGLAKRHELNRIAHEQGYDALVTGHNLDDEVAVLFANTLNWSAEHLVRQEPVLPGTSGFTRKAKPFCRFYERETAAYALLRNIEYIYEECPYSSGSTTLAYKEMWNQLENQKPGTKLNYYLSFIHAKEKGLFAWTQAEKLQGLNVCPGCGQPTTSAGLCTFCRTVQQAAAV